MPAGEVSGRTCTFRNMTSVTESAPAAILRREEELPFVDIGDGSTLQLLQVDLASGIWVVRNHFAPGTTIQTHKHTGPVFAFTQKGRWHYLEYPDAVNVAGSYLYEPAGSVHTLHVPEDNDGVTDVWFTIHGANLNLDTRATSSSSSTPTHSCRSTATCVPSSTASLTHRSWSSGREGRRPGQPGNPIQLTSIHPGVSTPISPPGPVPGSCSLRWTMPRTDQRAGTLDRRFDPPSPASTPRPWTRLWPPTHRAMPDRTPSRAPPAAS